MNTKIYSNSCVNKKICFNKKNKKTMSKKRKKVRKKKEVNGLKKIAKLTSLSIKSAYEGYKKSQKVKKREIARLEKISQKKELRIREEQIKKNQEKILLKEEEQRLQDKEREIKENELIKKDNELSNKEHEIKLKIEELKLKEKDIKNKLDKLIVKEEEQKRKDVDLKVREDEQRLKEQRERRRKLKEQKIKAQQEQKERDLENIKIKEWEEKFDKEQKFMEEKERIKEERIRLREIEYRKSKNLDNDDDKVKEELSSKGFDQAAIDKLDPVFAISGNNREKLQAIKSVLQSSEVGLKGINELEEVLNILDSFGTEVPELELDITLARGLSYYTGIIFEVKATDVEIGSITGGGRYDNLTGVFGLEGTSGVGISFGLDRIYDVLEEKDLFPSSLTQSSDLLIVHFDEVCMKHGLGLLKKLRDAGIRAEVYPESVKMKKQFTYADKKTIPFVLTIGSNEIEKGEYAFKNLKDGTQQMLSIDQIIEVLKG